MNDKTPQIVISAFPSELGWMAVEFRDQALVRLTFNHPSQTAALAALNAKKTAGPLSNAIEKTIERLKKFAESGRDDLGKVPVEYGPVTAFQRKVLNACRAIAPGETLSYAQLARIAGAPGAARAVGNVMRTNRLPLVVPCHRVVGSGGGLGGYSAPDGLRMKRRLLEREGVQVL